MTEAEMQSIMRRDAEAAVRALRARVAELHAALDLADCTQRECGDVRHCGEARCWRYRAEAAEKRVAELEAKLAESAGALDLLDLYESRRAAAEQRVAELEGALGVACEWLDGWLPDEANDCGGREMRRGLRAALAVRDAARAMLPERTEAPAREGGR